MGGAIGADEHDPGSNLPLGMITIVEPGLRVPIKTWLPPVEIDAGAMDQLRNAASHPAVGSHVAVMPDCHVGFGVSIGCVFPTVGEVVPTAG